MFDPVFMTIEDPVDFLQTGTVAALVLLVVFLLWLTGLSLSCRVSRLPPRRKTMVNLLSLFTGPVGWAIHLASAKQRREADPAGEAPPASSLSINHGNENGPAPTPASATTTADDTAAAPAPGPKRPAWLAWLYPEERQRSADSKSFEKLMEEAVQFQATDIHLEPQEDHLLARVRVNGILRDHCHFPKETGVHFIAIIKVLANMNVADKLRAQDGRFQWTLPGHGQNLDVRVSISPSLRGEKAALRFLNRPTGAMELSNLGMSEEMQKTVRRVTRHPEGFILIAGPTGSGKTSTAYSVLQAVAGPSVNTMTIEDPVEYTLPHATQIAINPKMGVTFETGLTTILRQDPDVIFIGEMRGADSFRTGIRASLSGHLVLSTMHARNANQVFANLRDIGIEPSSLAASVKMVIAQRLVRVLCDDCKQPEDQLDDDIRAFLGHDADLSLLRQPGPGCETCYQSGFIGRVGVFECITMDSAVRDWIEKGKHDSDLRKALAAQGRTTMRDDAREKVLAGWVWAEDAIRSVGLEVEV